MAHQIQVRYITEDGRSTSLCHTLRANGHSEVDEVSIVDVYTLDATLSAKELEKVADALHSPLSQVCAINKALNPSKFAYAFEIGFLPGVTDNVGTTARETIIDTLKKKMKDANHVFTSRIYFLDGKLSLPDAQAIANSLYNPLIQRCFIKSFTEYKKEKGHGYCRTKSRFKTRQRFFS